MLKRKKHSEPPFSDIHLEYRESRRVAKMLIQYRAFRTAGLLAQILCIVLFFILVLVILSGSDLFPPGRAAAAVLFALLAPYVLYAPWWYGRQMKKLEQEPSFQREKDGGGYMVDCRISGRCVTVTSRAPEAGPVTLWFSNVEKMNTWKKNVYLHASYDKKHQFMIIPAEAFTSDAQYKECRAWLKQAVREQQDPGKRRSLVGSFAGGLGRGCLGYLWACMKLFLFCIAALALLLFIMWLALQIKGM